LAMIEFLMFEMIDEARHETIPSVPSAAILLVRNLLHPVDGAAVELLGDGDMRHGRGAGCPVPVFLTGREPRDVAGPDFLEGTALALHPAQPGCDDQRLTERMRVPGCPRARFKGDGCPADAGWICTGERSAMRTTPVKYSAGPLADGCEPFRLISNSTPFAKSMNPELF
jgi:hypothetical protein